ncbi:phosphotransferase family protein [Amycolatopsis sp. NPDC059027]|uniref:phosphotransferase family protein n=1 Tax=unclassified Amycolatopsis TaxID=2618356 RepID=UPI00366D251C
MSPEVAERCARVVGPCDVVADLSWPHGEARVLALRGEDEREWIAKTVLQKRNYQRERDAYLNWASPLRGHVPELLHHDDELRLLLLARLPGELVQDHPAEFSADVHFQAGALTRRLHDVAAPEADPEFGARLLRKFENVVARADGLVPADGVTFTRRMLRALIDQPPPSVVPCHRDNQPRNWLIDDAGVVRFIDFGRVERDVWVADLHRLHFREWATRPDLREAFLSGYGRRPSAPDLALFRTYNAFSAVSTIVWAHEHDDVAFEAHGRTMLTEVLDGSA